MNEAQIKSLIDYYIMSQPTSWATYILAAAFVASVIGLFVSRAQLKTSSRHHVRDEWNSLMDACIGTPQFIDTSFTSNYNNTDDRILLSKYEAFCYKAWSLVEFIVRRKLQNENPFSTIVTWVAAYHRDWLEINPYMFSSKNFWKVYNAVRNEPLTIFRNHGLPRVGDNVDWDKVSTNYLNLVISPWAPIMTSPDPNNLNQPRNVLLAVLNGLQTAELKKSRIIEYGCGPGNILEFLQGHVGEISGLDISKKALSLCEEKAQKLNIKFNAINEDMRTFVAKEKFELIISTNAVLPNKRDDILKIFRGMHENLSANGRLLLILPSFDTCIALAEYWAEYYRRRSNFDNEYVRRCVAAFKASKKMDETNLSFADDGVHSQCFHTPASIVRELGESGFEIVGELQKVKYPWEYARRFDYGDFPGKPEIWDWYVEARKSSNRA
jgi:ubiquinone/menaquinone biosynthesis C-methylase UbiE